MMILHVLARFRPDIGGVQRATENLAAGLVARGVGTEVLTGRLPDVPKREVVQGVLVHRLGVGPAKVGALTFGLAALAKILRHDRRTTVVHSQEIDTAVFVGMLATVIGFRWLVTIQGEGPILDKLATRAGRMRLQLMRHFAHHFVAITPENAHALRKCGVEEDRISVLPNGVDTEFFRPPTAAERSTLRQRYDVPLEQTVVLFQGRLVEFKRVDILLQAIAKLSPEQRCRYFIVGDGPERARLEKLAVDLGVTDVVRFMGPTDRVRDYYWLSDVFVLPSTIEGLSVALLESMACGNAVVVTDSPGNLAVVQHGMNGIATPIGDVTALSEALRACATDDMRPLGAAARATVVEKFDASAIAAAHEGLYARMLAASRTGVVSQRPDSGRLQSAS